MQKSFQIFRHFIFQLRMTKSQVASLIRNKAIRETWLPGPLVTTPASLSWPQRPAWLTRVSWAPCGCGTLTSPQSSWSIWPLWPPLWRGVSTSGTWEAVTRPASSLVSGVRRCGSRIHWPFLSVFFKNLDHRLDLPWTWPKGYVYGSGSQGQVIWWSGEVQVTVRWG